jgi:hypothetical protein
MAAVVSTVVIGGDGAGTLVLGEHGGGAADVDEAVEEITVVRPKRAAQETGTDI